MARNKLTDTKAKSAKPGWHGDGDGLWLRVNPSGTRSWVFVSIRHGRRREMGLGSYGAGARNVTLAVARGKAEAVRAILGHGGDATSFPRDVAEMALAHKVGDEVEQAYRRGSALAKRRKLMEAWASYCSTVKGDNVLPMKQRAAE